MDTEAEFFKLLIKQSLGEKVEDSLMQLSRKIPWAEGLPEKKEAFWSAESYLWHTKIDEAKRRCITEKLREMLPKGTNLDLGAGAHSYVPSIAFDCSAKMLDKNANAMEKVVGDLEKHLPFKENEFTSITAVFLLNYLEKIPSFLTEVKRILQERGTFVAILSAKGVNSRHKRHEKSNHTQKEWCKIFKNSGFDVTRCDESDLWFFTCTPKL